MRAGEQRIRDRAGSGEFIDLNGEVVDPAIIRDLLVGAEAHIVGPRGLLIKGARFDEPVDLGYCDLAHPITFAESTFAEAPNFARCRIPSLGFLRCGLPGLTAGAIEVGFDAWLIECTVSDAIDLASAKIGAGLNFSGTSIAAPDEEPAIDVALGLVGAEIRASIFLTGGFRAQGKVHLLGAHLGGALNCAGASFANLAAPALDADHAAIDGGIQLTKAVSAGEVRAVLATIGGDVVCSGATLDHPSGDALTLDGSRIAGSVYLDEDFSARGGVRLTAATVAGSIICSDAKITGHPAAFVATRAEIATWLTFQRADLEGGVALVGTRAAGLIDDLGTGEGGLGSWAHAEPLLMTGFDYAGFAGDANWDRKRRFEWLAHTQSFDPQAWSHLAEVYRAEGRDSDARLAAIEGQNDRLRRGKLSPLHYIGRWLLRLTIGHGYRPWLAGAWAIAIIAAFAFFVGHHTSSFVPENDDVRGHPQAMIYAADTFIPVIDYGEAAKWAPAGNARWAEWAVISIGWTLSTLFVAGFTRAIRT